MLPKISHQVLVKEKTTTWIAYCHMTSNTANAKLNNVLVKS